MNYVTKYVVYSPEMRQFVPDVRYGFPTVPTSVFELAYHWGSLDAAIAAAFDFSTRYENTPFYVYELIALTVQSSNGDYPEFVSRITLRKAHV